MPMTDDVVAAVERVAGLAKDTLWAAGGFTVTHTAVDDSAYQWVIWESGLAGVARFWRREDAEFWIAARNLDWDALRQLASDVQEARALAWDGWEQAMLWQQTEQACCGQYDRLSDAVDALRTALRDRDARVSELEAERELGVSVCADAEEERGMAEMYARDLKAENDALRERLAVVTKDRDGLSVWYQKVVMVALDSDPIPAAERDDDTLEPPWEVFARIRRERDEARERLAVAEGEANYGKSLSKELGAKHDALSQRLATVERERDEARREAAQQAQMFHEACVVCPACSEAGGADMPVHHTPPTCDEIARVRALEAETARLRRVEEAAKVYLQQPGGNGGMLDYCDARNALRDALTTAEE
jgi:hypothetical protein